MKTPPSKLTKTKPKQTYIGKERPNDSVTEAVFRNAVMKCYYDELNLCISKGICHLNDFILINIKYLKFYSLQYSTFNSVGT